MVSHFYSLVHSSRLFRDIDGCFRTMRGVWTDPNLYVRRFSGIFVLVVPKCEGIRAQTESDAPRFAWSQFDVLETLEGANRLSRACAFEANVKLNDFLARASTHVGD